MPSRRQNNESNARIRGHIGREVRDSRKLSESPGRRGDRSPISLRLREANDKVAFMNAPANPNKALWEKGDFTRIADTMRESGEALVQRLGITQGLKVLDLG